MILELSHCRERANGQTFRAGLDFVHARQRLDVHEPLGIGQIFLHQGEQVVAAGEISAVGADEFARGVSGKCGCVFECFHAAESLSLPSAASTRCGVMGRLLTRTPMALATALPIAAAVGMVTGSPMPMTPRSAQ